MLSILLCVFFLILLYLFFSLSYVLIFHVTPVSEGILSKQRWGAQHSRLSFRQVLPSQGMRHAGMRVTTHSESQYLL